MMFRPVSVLLIAACIAAPAALSAEGNQAQTAQTSLQQLLEAARNNADVVRAREAGIRAARWQKYRADKVQRPKFTSETLLAPVPGNADLNYFGRNVDAIARGDIGPYVRQQFGTLLPLYTFGRIKIAQELAAIGVDVAELEKKQAVRQLEFQVKQAYYGVRLSNSFAELLTEGNELIEENLAEMEEAREFGEADFPISSLRKLQIFAAEVDRRMLENRKLARLARSGLAYLTDVDGPFRVGTIDEDAEPAALTTLKRYQDTAMATRPEALMLDNAVEARGLQTRLAHRNYYPNIFVASQFGAGWSTENLALRRVCRRIEPGGPCVDTDDLYARPYRNPLDFLSLQIGVGIVWEFDYWQLKGARRYAQSQEEEVTAQRDRAIGAILLEVEKLYVEASHAREVVSIEKRRLEAARRWRDQAGLSIQTGGDEENAIEPLKAYYEARANFLEARFNYLVARAALAEAVGVSDLDEIALDN